MQVFNYLLGSLSRIYTTVQEVPDPLILYSFVAGFVLNAVLAAQMVYYWNSPSSKAAAKKGKATSAIDAPSTGQSTGVSAAKPKTPSTRRRG